jgi:hypothetical protein
MELVLQEVEEITLIPEETILTAEVLAVTEVVKPWKDEKTGEDQVKIAFDFMITDPEHRGVKVSGETPTTFNNGSFCKLYGWVCELMGRDSLPEKFKLDTELLVGSPCRIVIAHTKPKDPKKNRPREFVSDVLRPSTKAASTSEDPF